MSLKKCPVCKIEMFMAERQGVEIDYCKKCGGVWLDKDELDAIIDISDKSMNEQILSRGETSELQSEEESFLSGFFDFSGEED